MKYIIAALTFFCLVNTTKAQQVRPATSAQVYHEIAQLKNLTNVLYFAAHPDDENTRLLAWLVNDQHIRTAYLSLTRGDGGQNILGPEQGAALGLIRTHELLKARELDGAEQYFTRAIDFGFSKTSDETFKHWDADVLTGDAVWTIRKFRPDVIICRFPPTAQAGHGHHAASAIIAAKAFDAAGSDEKYPEQLSLYNSWQPKRLLFNAFKFGSANTTSEDMYKLGVGNYSPLLGMGYGELAGISRSIHKSQGAGTPSVPGIQTEYFKVVKGDSITNSIFDGIDITWNRVNRKDIGDDIQAILNEYDFKHPEKSLPALLDLRKEIATVNDKYWREQKLKELDEAILHAAGIMAEFVTRQQPEAVAGETLPFTLNIISRADVSVRIKNINWLNADSATNIKLGKDTLLSLAHTVKIPDNAWVTEPYWIGESNETKDQYPISDIRLLGLPETPNKLNAILKLKIGSEYFDLDVPLSYKKLDPTHGDMVEALRIVPQASVSFTSDLLVTAPDGSLTATVRLHPFKDISNADLTVSYKKGINAHIQSIGLKKGVDTLITVYYTSKQVDSAAKEDFTLIAFLRAGSYGVFDAQHIIKYDHIGTLQYFTKTKVKVVKRDWQTKVKHIGYVEGAGDNVDDVLRLTGLQVDVLKDADINAARLKQYDAILVGIRAVNTEKKIANWMPELLRYTENGGTLVMQYNTLQDMATTTLGPYPITLSSKRVTEEDAKVEYLQPTHKLLNYPNKITNEDWNGWVQERGLYFPEKWDEHYTPLFSMHDAGEEALKGSTLYTKYGKGNYVYTSLSFFRQLPAGNKGAIKLMMNMLSAGK
jgi:LmbE family N-acetylglucosaminyl deacetylase